MKTLLLLVFAYNNLPFHTSSKQLVILPNAFDLANRMASNECDNCDSYHSVSGMVQLKPAITPSHVMPLPYKHYTPMVNAI